MTAAPVPGCHSSTGQNLDESGVRASSASTMVPSGRAPNSSLVSATMMPRSRATSSARSYTSNVSDRSFGRDALADSVGHGLVGDVLIMLAYRGLRRRREDRLGQSRTVLEMRRQLDPAHLAGRRVVAHGGAGEVSARDALDREHVQPLTDHGAAGDLVRDLGRDQVVGNDVRQPLEPPRRHPREDLALVRDPSWPAHGRTPRCGRWRPSAAGRHEVVQVSHLARVEVRSTGDLQDRTHVRHPAMRGWPDA